MANAERRLGLFELIREQQRKNQESKRFRDDDWDIYGDREVDTRISPRPLFNGYQRSFESVLKGISIVSFISKKQEPVVVDVMSPTDTLIDLSTREELRGKKLLGVAVSYRDKRNKEKRSRDKLLNIYQIKGDVMDNRVWKKVEKRLDGRKADLIMERAAGGLSCIPDNPIFYAALLIKIWKLLSEKNGMFLGEFRPYLFEERLSGEITDYLHRNNVDIVIEGNAVRVIKTPSSPDDIGHILRRIEELEPLRNTFGIYGYALPNNIIVAKLR